MRSRLTVMALCVPSILLAQQPSSGDVDRTIRGLEDRWRAAQQANDTVAFHELLAPDVTFIGTSGTLRDRADYIASRSGSWIPRATSFTIDELRLRTYGTVVIVTGRGTTTGAETEARVRFTDVWARRDARWMLVAIHRTDIAPASPPVPVSTADSVAVQRRGWASSRPHSYVFTYRDQCFCQGSNLWVRIWVVGDTVARAELLPVQDPGISRSSAFRRPTIDSLFVWLADAYNRKADRVDVQFDPKYHFPSHADLDWRKNVIDDEFTFEVRDFAAVVAQSAR